MRLSIWRSTQMAAGSSAAICSCALGLFVLVALTGGCAAKTAPRPATAGPPSVVTTSFAAVPATEAAQAASGLPEASGPASLSSTSQVALDPATADMLRTDLPGLTLGQLRTSGGLTVTREYSAGAGVSLSLTARRFRSESAAGSAFVARCSVLPSGAHLQLVDIGGLKSAFLTDGKDTVLVLRDANVLLELRLRDPSARPAEARSRLQDAAETLLD